jgi:hypothetical protein
MNDLENCTVLFNIEKKDAPTQEEILKLLECSDDKVSSPGMITPLLLNLFTDEGESSEIGRANDA